MLASTMMCFEGRVSSSRVGSNFVSSLTQLAFLKETIFGSPAYQQPFAESLSARLLKLAVNSPVLGGPMSDSLFLLSLGPRLRLGCGIIVYSCTDLHL